MESEVELPSRQNSMIRLLPMLQQHKQCAAQLAIGQMDMKLEADSLWRATNGAIDILVASIHEDGLAKVTSEIKQRKPNFETITVELVSHLSLAHIHPDFQKISYEAATIFTPLKKLDWRGKVIIVRDDEAVVSGRQMAQIEGLQDDILTCALLCAAVQTAQQLENAGKLV